MSGDDDPTAAMREFVHGVMRDEMAAIDEVAERILLSGTNWGIRVWRWIDGDRVHIVAEPTPETRTVEFRDGPAPDDLAVWRVCPNGCKGGWVSHVTSWGAEDPRHCTTCDGMGWVDIR